MCSDGLSDTAPIKSNAINAYVKTPDAAPMHCPEQRKWTSPRWRSHAQSAHCENAQAESCGPAGSIIAAVVTLHPHEGMPLPKWPFKISINSLLSIYSLVFKATLGFVLAACIGQLQWIWFSSERRMYDLTLYDGAGRGVWGSLQLLSIQRLRQPLTALGAIIVSAALNASRNRLRGLHD